jgi:serine/threonine-protein kinase
MMIQRFFNGWRDFPLKEGTLLAGRYEVLNVIGQGSFGITYRSADRQRQNDVVIVKQSRPSKGERARTMLVAEAEILDRVQHSSVPLRMDLFSDRKNYYLVMDYIEGDTFEQLIFEKGVIFDESDCAAWGLKILQAVAHIHHRGYVHLDLRLPNIVVRDGSVYILDFGLARKIGDHHEEQAPQSGKLPYRHLAEPTTDLAAIGHLMLYLLYSTFEVSDNDSLNEERSWEEELCISQELRMMLRKLLQLDEPFATAVEAIEALQPIIEHKKTGLPPVSMN